jgi:hypothetical protein
MKTTLALLACAALLVTAACHRAPPPPAPGPANLGEAWGTQLERLPDWSGLWFLNDGFSFPGRAQTVLAKDPADQGGFSYGELPGTYFTGAPYKPEYQKLYDERVRVAREEFKVFDTMGSCIIPHGMPRILGGGPGPTEFIVTPEQTTIIWDYMNELRRIYTDGRPHPEPSEFRHTVMGHSIGKWEGDTLVVDTTFLKAGIYDRSGAPHSNEVRLTERIWLATPNSMEFDITIEDPVMFTGPWHVTRTMRRMENSFLEPEGSYCENNRNPVSADGQTAVLGSEEP